MHYQEDKTLFTIGVVKKLTGLSERQIRYYDNKELVVPARTQGNKRIYTPHEVDKLKEIKKLIEKGMKIKEIKDYLTSCEQNKEQLTAEVKQHYQRDKRKQSIYLPSYLDEWIKKIMHKKGKE